MTKNMEKLPLCRVCLAENVRMYSVDNKSLHELYERLTGNPFVTEDRRPMLTCYFCCTRLKQCYQLQRKCLEAEELFIQMINEDHELNPFVNQDPIECFNGFIQSPVEHISIGDERQTESDAVKIELDIPAVNERQNCVIEPKEEYLSDELELENQDNSSSDVEDIPEHHLESNSESDVPFMEFKIDVDEEQISRKKRRASDTEPVKMSSSNENGDLSLQIKDKGKDIVFNLLPLRSQSIYLNTYEKFMKWRAENRVDSLTEGVFLTYFDELSKKYQCSTLWSMYSMLRTTIQTRHNVNIKKYAKLTAFLKKSSTGYKAKKSKVFTRKDIDNFLYKAPDEKYLATKVALIFGISGACRVTEMANLSVEDVETDTHLQAIKLPNTKQNKERKFVISGEFLKIVKAYQDLRPTEVNTSRFFLNYQNGKCTRQVIGKNKFSNMPKEIATYLNLPYPEQYTGHCFRRTSATLLADSGANITTLKRHDGWRSDQLAEGYIIENSIQNKFDITHCNTERNNILPTSPRPSTSRDESNQLLLYSEDSNEGPSNMELRVSPTFITQITQRSSS